MQHRSPRRRGRAARRRLSLQRSFGGLTGNTATPGPTRTLRPSARARQQGSTVDEQRCRRGRRWR
jgi:hypothetical protein